MFSLHFLKSIDQHPMHIVCIEDCQNYFPFFFIFIFIYDGLVTGRETFWGKNLFFHFPHLQLSTNESNLHATQSLFMNRPIPTHFWLMINTHPLLFPDWSGSPCWPSALPCDWWADDQRRPSSDRTGYIISVFRVMEGDDRHSFERDWPSWTGERQANWRTPGGVASWCRWLDRPSACRRGQLDGKTSCRCLTAPEK